MSVTSPAVFSPDTERLFNTVKKPFVAAVNRASRGAIEIELFPNGALGRAPQQQAQMVLDGVADIGFIVPPFTPGRFPESEVLELPGLFRDLAEGTRVYTRLVQSGVLVLAFAPPRSYLAWVRERPRAWAS